MTDPTVAFGESFAKLTEALPAAIGAMVSMKFLPATLSLGQRATALLAGYAIGTYVGRGITEYLGITSPRLTDAIVFGVAMFGLSFVGTLMSEIKPIVQALRVRWIGTAPSDREAK